MARAPINGTTLSWARAALGVDLHDLARHVAVKVEAAQQWETGDLHPTVGQLRAIADKLERPPAFFFAPPPEAADVPAVPDFRGKHGEGIPTVVLREIKRAEQYRETLLELSGVPEGSLEYISFDRSGLVKAAARLRQELMTGWPAKKPATPGEMFNTWRDLLEMHGVLVFQSTRIPLTDYRALSVHHYPYPVILVNGADAANGKIFSLFHELAHLMNRSSGVCMILDNNEVEALCNAFAAEFLMPAVEVRTFLGVQSPTRPISSVANRFGVSTLAAAIRLRSLGQIDDQALTDQRAENDAEWNRARAAMAAKAGNPPPWRLRYRDLGNTYVRTVLTALQTNRIDYLSAAYMLNARVPMIEKMQQEFHRRGEV